MTYLIKLAITSVLVVLISEISKRSTLMGAVLASLPLVSLLAMLWLYIETGDAEKVSAFSSGVFWMVLPSLVMFLLLPLLLKNGWGFYPGLAVSAAATIASYFAMIAVLGHFGIRL